MKVTVTTGGDVVIDTANAAEAAAFVRELHGLKPRRKKRTAKSAPLELESASEPLSEALVDTWNWLVANDRPEGYTATEMAAGLGLKAGSASYRLTQLVSKSLAHRVDRHHFRPGEA